MHLVCLPARVRWIMDLLVWCLRQRALLFVCLIWKTPVRKLRCHLLPLRIIEQYPGVRKQRLQEWRGDQLRFPEVARGDDEAATWAATIQHEIEMHAGMDQLVYGPSAQMIVSKICSVQRSNADNSENSASISEDQRMSRRGC